MHVMVVVVVSTPRDGHVMVIIRYDPFYPNHKDLKTAREFMTDYVSFALFWQEGEDIKLGVDKVDVSSQLSIQSTERCEHIWQIGAILDCVRLSSRPEISLEIFKCIME